MNVPPGTVVGGRYRIDALLGRGTAGAVYRAVDRSGRSCAIKMLQPVHCPNPKSVEVFVEQARLAASLHHPSIRAVWNAGIDDLLGSPFITMELLDGSDVATHLREVGAFTATSLRRVLEQVADAVATAHRSAIIHGALKPSNVFLCGHADAVKVLDFALVKPVGAGRPLGSSAIVGAPEWLAPEQLTAGTVVGPWTDVWGFGLLTFFCLTGRHYWLSPNGHGRAPGSVFVEILSTAPRIPASARAAELGCELRAPSAFDAWLDACIAVEPQRRHRYIDACWQALRALLDATTRSGPSPSVDAQPSVPDDDVVARTAAEILRRTAAAIAATVSSERPSRRRVLVSKPVTPAPPCASVPAIPRPPSALPSHQVACVTPAAGAALHPQKITPPQERHVAPHMRHRGVARRTHPALVATIAFLCLAVVLSLVAHFARG